MVVFGTGKQGLFPFGNVKIVNFQKTLVTVRFVRLAVAGFGRCRGLLCALCLLLLFPILAHGGSHRLKALVRDGVLL